MEITVSQKVAVITGGTKGIGLAIAKLFLQEGAYVAICSSNSKNVEESLVDLSDFKDRLLVQTVDVSSKAQLESFTSNVMSRFGKIDIWINNAGVYPQHRLMETSEDIWDRTMDINLKSVYLGCVIAGKLMQEQNSGVIINASSFAAIIPSLGSGAYAASKSSIRSMTKSFAAELAPYQIRVNSYIPGVIDTDMTSEVIREKHEALIENIALKRIGLASEVAESILFLCSDAASYITGTSLEISGGKYCVQA